MTKALKLTTYSQDAFYSSQNKFCSLERSSFNPRYRLDLLTGLNDGKKSIKNSDRLTDNQGFKRKTNPLEKNVKV